MNNQGDVVDLPAALLQLTTLLLLAVASWATLVALLASWRSTKRIAVALTPHLVRAALFTTVSGTLVISPARAAGDLDGLPYPDRATTTAAPAVELAADTTTGRHVVRTGESLWSIAAETLPPDATAAQVTRTAAAWYEANRATIGADPDLILPGQELTAPDAEATR